VVRDALTYLGNHQDKMCYDEYRKAGLPLMSSHVETTVKQINYRVKGTEKFWTQEGAEAILKLRADPTHVVRPRAGKVWRSTPQDGGTLPTNPGGGIRAARIKSPPWL
jgi:hypothetical protein